MLCTHLHTYIIGHYIPSVRIIDLVSHTTYVMCVNFLCISGGTYSFKVDSERKIFWEIFHGNFIYSQSFCQKYAGWKSPKKYFSYFLLMSGSNSDFSSNKPTHYLLDHGDFKQLIITILQLRLRACFLHRLYIVCKLILYMSGEAYSLK